MSLGLLATPTVTICKVAKMVFNVAPGNFYLSQYLEYQEANGTSATVEALAGLAGGTDAAFVTTVLTNLGLADDAGAQAFLETSIAASGRGAALEAAITALDNVAADDATYGNAAAQFNASVVKSVVFSSNVANNTTNVSQLTAAAAVEVDESGAVVESSVAEGFNFSLTAGDDFVTTLSGTLNGGTIKLTDLPSTGNDTFTGNTAGNLSNTDQLDGGEGTDTLTAKYSISAAATVQPTVSNIESITLNVESDSDGTAENLLIETGSFTGATAFTVNPDATTAGANGDTVEIDDITLTQSLAIGGGDGTFDINVDYKSVTGSADAATITLQKAKHADLDTAGIETLTLVGSQAASSGAAADENTIAKLVDTNMKKLVIEGTNKVNITSLDTGNNTALDEVDASASTGGIKIAGMTTADVGSTMSIIGSGVDDEVSVAGLVLSGTASIDLGEGTDTIVVADAAELTSATAAKMLGVETLAVRAATGGDTFNLNLLESVTSLEIGDQSGAVTVNNTPLGNILISGDSGAVNTTVAFRGASGSADEITITLDNATKDTDVDLQQASFNGVETVNIVSTGAGTEQNSITFRSSGLDKATSVVVTGDSKTKVDLSNASKAVALDLSGATGAQEAVLNAKAGSVTGSAQVDTVTLGSVSVGKATLALGAGKDAISGTIAQLAVNSINGEADSDTLTLSDAVPTLVDANFANLTNVDVIKLSGDGDSTAQDATSITLGGFAQSLATSNGGTLEFNIVGLDLADDNTGGNVDSFTFDASAFTTASTKLTLTDADSAEVNAFTVKGGALADTFTITLGAGQADTLALTPGGGADTVTLATAAAVDTTMTYTANAATEGGDMITGFAAGANNDVIDASAAGSFNNTTTEAVIDVTSSTFTIGNNNLVAIKVGTQYDTEADALAVIEGGTLVASKAFYYAWNDTNGDAHVGVIVNDSTAKFAAADDTYYELVKLVGVDADDLVATNFVSS